MQHINIVKAEITVDTCITKREFYRPHFIPSNDTMHRVWPAFCIIRTCTRTWNHRPTFVMHAFATWIEDGHRYIAAEVLESS